MFAVNLELCVAWGSLTDKRFLFLFFVVCLWFLDNWNKRSRVYSRVILSKLFLAWIPVARLTLLNSLKRVTSYWADKQQAECSLKRLKKRENESTPNASLELKGQLSGFIQKYFTASGFPENRQKSVRVTSAELESKETCCPLQYFEERVSLKCASCSFTFNYPQGCSDATQFRRITLASELPHRVLFCPWAANLEVLKISFSFSTYLGRGAGGIEWRSGWKSWAWLPAFSKNWLFAMLPYSLI